MKYIDYEWDLSDEGIVIDNEINTDKLGWKAGDYFKFTNINGQQMLVKIDVMEKFLVDGTKREKE